ncbi:HD domain-containing phosphohydrolase [Blastococcus deserti]|uniref:HD domain-containing phosphohydrolase n=1 Tax=Blastococcus deserti TaxID=2259033 RepID=A0ABW4X960_9ACTN
MPRARVAEVFAALSLTTDLATGVPFEKGLRTCALATAFAAELELDDDGRAAVFHVALLRSIGCTANASENAALFEDDTAFEAAFSRLDPGDPDVLADQLGGFGRWVPQRQAELARTFLAVAPVEGQRASRAGCEVSRALGRRLGLSPAAVDALDDVYERWDGRGLPGARHGEQVSLLARIVHVAEQAVLAAAEGGAAAAVREVARRAGGHLDPDLAAAFLRSADTLLPVIDVPDLLAAVLAAEPAPAAAAGAARVDDLCAALAAVVDLKGRYLLGHSTHVAAVAAAAAVAAGLPDARREAVRSAALLHDLGRVAVSSAVWDRPGPLGAADRERVRLHTYWTDRVLRRCTGLAALAESAAGHHERCDGSGYHRGTSGAELSFDARLLAAADVFAALTEERPHRSALGADVARATLVEEAAAGRLDPDACAAVLAGAGLPRPRRAWPCDLTDREVEVLRLAARGMSNRAIADRLGVSDRTVGHHLAHVFDKTGRRTRAGAAVFAMEHGLLPG